VFLARFWYSTLSKPISVHSSMSSLADAPDLVGFFSYSREDDEDFGGKLSKLRERIQAELRGQLGRTKADFRLWQDKTAIAHGKLWEHEIKSAIAESVFFIPIITPTAVRSHHCKFEFDSFLAREKELGRSDLVFPILYIPVPALTGDRWRQDPLLSIIGSRQYEQWQNLRQLDPSSTEVALRVEKFCANICGALQQPWLSPQERREAEARQQVEEERRRQEKLQEEARQQVEEERRRQEKLQEEARQQVEEERRREEAQTRRRLDEAEAEKRRQDKERRKLEKEAAWAAKKEKLHRWRGAAAAGAAVVVLLMVGGIWLYRTTTPAGVTSAVVQPDASGADKAKAAADAEAQRKAEETEQQRLAAAKAEEERNAKAAAEAEARAKAEQAEQERLAAAKAEEARKAKAAADAEAQRKSEEAERLAALRAEEQRYDRAIAGYSEAIRLDPKNAAAFHNRGLVYFWMKGDSDRAIADYSTAIRLNPKYIEALINRGIAYWMKGDSDQAIADYSTAIRHDPNNAVAFCHRGKARLRINEAGGNADIAKARELNASSCQ
jgi:tetratricopeptide (TPR) repeat protein